MNRRPSSTHFIQALPDPLDLLPAPGVGASPPALPTATVDLSPGAVFDLHAGAVYKRFGGKIAQMFAFNGSIPGPTLKVAQDSEVIVHFTNDLDSDALVHWHGLRMSNLFDGLPRGNQHSTHLQVPPGGSFSYRLRFPDPGLFWYHNYTRGDCSPAHGLYGGIIVMPSDPGYWPSADRELVLILDEILLRVGNAAVIDPRPTDETAPAECDRLTLLNGDSSCALQAHRGQVVRLYLANVANTRIFRLSIPGAQVKYIGGDVGRVEREILINEVSLCPWQRVIVDLFFEQAGHYRIEDHAPGGVRVLGCVEVSEPVADARLSQAFRVLRQSDALRMERDTLLADWERQPDRVLLLTAGAAEPEPFLEGHPGRGLEREAAAAKRAYVVPNGENSPWQVVDLGTGAVNDQIDWSFGAGDRVRIRLVHEPAAGADIQHPVHFHGQRFLVLAHNGARSDNLVWQDSLLLRAGDTIDLLLEAANPGAWQVHFHRPGYGESHMLFTLHVQ